MTSPAPSFSQRANAALWLVTGASFLAWAAPSVSGFLRAPLRHLPSPAFFVVIGALGVVLGVARLQRRNAFPGLYVVASFLLLAYSAVFVLFPQDFGPTAHFVACLWLAVALWSLGLAAAQHVSGRRHTAD